MGNTFRKTASINLHESQAVEEQSVHESNKQKFRTQIRYKRVLNFVVLFIMLTQIITLILDYFIGEFIIANDSISDIFIQITGNIGQQEIYEIKILEWEDNCTKLSTDIMPNMTFEKENLNYTGRYTLCKNKFIIDHTKVDSNIYVDCKGYNVVGKRCPWHTPEVKELIKQDTLINNIFWDTHKYTINYRIEVKLPCVTELKNFWFMPMNKYGGTYYIYTAIIVCIILLEISTFVKFNKHYKEYIFEDPDIEDSNISLPWMDKQTTGVKNYASHRKLMMENLQAIRLLIVFVLIYSGFLLFNFYLQKGSSYNSNFKRIQYLALNECFVKPIYNSYITQFYEDNFQKFCVFYYYRVTNNFFSGLCIIFILCLGLKAFTWKELFCTTQKDVMKVFAETGEND
jgi:hypothetical protein